MAGKQRDKVYVVTGAGRNIGRAIAELFASEGAKVAVVDNDEDAGGDVVDAISSNDGGDAKLVRTDVTSNREVESMVETVVDTWGTVDGLVNNVAATVNKSVLACSEDEWNQVLHTTLTSAFLCTKHCAEVLKENGGGAIVNIGSTSAHRGTPEKVAYCTAKSGLLNFTRQTAVDLAPYDIRVNTLSPTRTGSALGYEEGGPGRHTEGILRNRLGTPMDQANAALYLMSDAADFVTGTELVVDGGTLATF